MKTPLKLNRSLELFLKDITRNSDKWWQELYDVTPPEFSKLFAYLHEKINELFCFILKYRLATNFALNNAIR